MRARRQHAGNDSASGREPTLSSDAALLAAALDGDQAAARDLVGRHGGRVYACALRMLGDAATAEDVVQDVFTMLLQHGHSFRNESALGTWLYAVTLNRCRNMLRRSSFRAASEAQPLKSDLRDNSPDPQQLLEQRERQDRLGDAIGQLSDDMREVVVLRFASGLSYEEIAEVIGCASGTVASRLHRALHRLGATLRAAGLTRESV
jgi:RNA polymerase sigma-70 factor (ECF subfamily)